MFLGMDPTDRDEPDVEPKTEKAKRPAKRISGVGQAFVGDRTTGDAENTETT